jgi:site-specific recombinase XerD
MTFTFSHIVSCFFTSYLAAERGLSENTIASYSDCMRLLIQHACEKFKVEPEKLGMEMFTRELVVEFLAHLETQRNNDAATTNQRLAAIKTFFHFLARHIPQLLRTNELIQAIRPKKTDHLPPPSLTPDEVKAILGVPDAATLIGARDQALLSLLYYTGARVQELADLTLSDLRLDSPATAFVRLTGKGRKQRTLPLGTETIQPLQHYLKMRKQAHIQSDHLFLNIENQPMTRFGIGRRIDVHVESAKKRCPSLDHRSISPHVFRHSTALHLIEAGVHITVVSAWLGHADIKTTSQYVEVSVQKKREALEKISAPTNASIPETPVWKQPGIMNLLSCLSRKENYVA